MSRPPSPCSRRIDVQAIDIEYWKISSSSSSGASSTSLSSLSSRRPTTNEPSVQASCPDLAHILKEAKRVRCRAQRSSKDVVVDPAQCDDMVHDSVEKKNHKDVDDNNAVDDDDGFEMIAHDWWMDAIRECVDRDTARLPHPFDASYEIPGDGRLLQMRRDLHRLDRVIMPMEQRIHQLEYERLYLVQPSVAPLHMFIKISDYQDHDDDWCDQNADAIPNGNTKAPNFMQHTIASKQRSSAGEASNNINDDTRRLHRSRTPTPKVRRRRNVNLRGRTPSPGRGGGGGVCKNMRSCMMKSQLKSSYHPSSNHAPHVDLRTTTNRVPLPKLDQRPKRNRKPIHLSNQHHPHHQQHQQPNRSNALNQMCDESSSRRSRILNPTNAWSIAHARNIFGNCGDSSNTASTPASLDHDTLIRQLDKFDPEKLFQFAKWAEEEAYRRAASASNSRRESEGDPLV